MWYNRGQISSAQRKQLQRPKGRMTMALNLDPNQPSDLPNLYRLFMSCLHTAHFAFDREPYEREYSVSLDSGKNTYSLLFRNPCDIIVYFMPERPWPDYCYWASHASIYCLVPPHGSPSVLEEAIATSFSLKLTRSYFLRERAYVGRNRETLKMVGQIDHDIIRLGQRVLSKVESFEEVTEEILASLYPDVDKEIISEVLLEFRP